MDKVSATAALVVVGLAIFGAAAGPAPSATAQTDERNFAGPASMCPGEDWNCVGPHAFPVEQAGTENVIVCVGDIADCAESSQDGEINKIECIDEQKGELILVQKCGPFTQTGDDAHNMALFRLTYDNHQGSNQCALQTGEILQEGATNQLKAQFRIVQETKGGTTQTQEAHQVVIAEQDAEEKNESDVEEVQFQKASGHATTQRQNTGIHLSGECTATVPHDCSVTTPGPTQPYACLNLEQEVTGGSGNVSKLKQEVKEEAETGSFGALQEQGSFHGGNDGRVHQEAPESGKNVDVATQKTEQKLSGRGAHQSQFEDPHCCGGGSQEGGQDNTETINQTVNQEASAGGAFQFASATAIGRSLNGGCEANQDIENNSDSAQVSETLEPCDPFLAVNTTCTSDSEGGGCSTDPEPSLCAEGYVIEINEETGEVRCVVSPPISPPVGPPS